MPGTTGNTVYNKELGDNPAQAQKNAQNTANQFGQFAYTIEITMAGDVNCNPTKSLQVSGTGSGFDATYTINSITHRFSLHDGYTMEITAQAAAGGAGGGTGSAPTSSDQVPKSKRRK